MTNTEINKYQLDLKPLMDYDIKTKSKYENIAYAIMTAGFTLLSAAVLNGEDLRVHAKSNNVSTNTTSEYIKRPSAPTGLFVRAVNGVDVTNKLDTNTNTNYNVNQNAQRPDKPTGLRVISTPATNTDSKNLKRLSAPTGLRVRAVNGVDVTNKLDTNTNHPTPYDLSGGYSIVGYEINSDYYSYDIVGRKYVDSDKTNLTEKARSDFISIGNSTNSNILK